eukprot:SAG22_NODE_1181_length_5234_cov_12.279455_7_plen_82_part_00
MASSWYMAAYKRQDVHALSFGWILWAWLCKMVVPLEHQVVQHASMQGAQPRIFDRSRRGDDGTGGGGVATRCDCRTRLDRN